MKVVVAFESHGRGLKLGVYETFRKSHGRQFQFTSGDHGNLSPFLLQTFSIEVLEFNNFGHNLSFYGEMAATTYMEIYQNYSKYIFNESIS